MPAINTLQENLIGNLNFSSRKSKRAGDFLDSQEPNPKTLLPLEAILAVILVFVFCLFVSNLVILQVFFGGENLATSLNNSLRKYPIKANRGLVVGQKGAVLAGNSPAFDLYFDPTLCPSGCNLEVLKKYGFYNGEVAKNFQSAKEVVLVRDISQSDALSLGQDLADYPFLQIKAGQKRSYKGAASFFHVLGYVSQATPDDIEGRSGIKASDKVGRLGVEKYYDDYLRGLDGGEIFESDARGKIIRKVKEIKPTAGDTVVLNIDEDLQNLSYEALAQGLKKSGAVAGSVVASDPSSGRILALVSLPSLDGNIFSSALSGADFAKLENDSSKPFFDRVISAAYPPGSVFKIVVGSGVLAENVVSEKTLIEGPGSISVGSFSFGDWKPEGHGRLTIVRAIQESCDTCFYTVGGGYGSQAGLGQEKIAKYARFFGLGKTLNIDLPNETGGLVPDGAWKKKTKGQIWYIGDTYHYAIGQGFLLTTPLQINFMTAVVANGGTLYKPQVTQKILDDKGQVARSFEPVVIKSKIVEAKYLEVVKEGMVKALKPGGTAYPFYDFKLSAAGKTGTAETGKKTTHAWFTVFAPVENPKIALTVFLEEGGEGSRDAAPVARKILDDYFALK